MESAGDHFGSGCTFSLCKAIMASLSQPHHEALSVLLARLPPAPVVWALTGSCSFALQGLPVSVHDIDLRTDARGAYAIEQLFSESSRQSMRRRPMLTPS